MDRPYIICHMLMSIDGKVTGDFLSSSSIENHVEHYYEINRKYKCDGFICGRVTMEGSFTYFNKVDLTSFKNKKVDRKDYVAFRSGFYAISFDRYGKVGWTSAFIKDEDDGYNNAHIIEVLTESSKDEYLLYLQSIGVSYIFAGENDIDIKVALVKLKNLFNINKLLLEGGSIINGAFINAECVDELSLVLVPITGQTSDFPLFYNCKIKEFELINIHNYNDNSIHLLYKKK